MRISATLKYFLLVFILLYEKKDCIYIYCQNCNESYLLLKCKFNKNLFCATIIYLFYHSCLIITVM